ncbi:heterokaryon incompatibility, partial [Phaeosphaeriaceae sp. SRC1lsM3a]
MSPVQLRGLGTSFEALSYAWGNHEKSRLVSVDGLVLAVTESLYLALLHMKRRKRTLNNLYMRPALWADAICINQDDDQEKTLQVAMMAEIYHAASKVNIWLGPDDKGEAEAAI